MDAIASQITSLTFVYSIVYSDADQRKHQSSASLAFVRGIQGTGEFSAQMASNAENVSIWWRHQGVLVKGFHDVRRPEYTAQQNKTYRWVSARKT